MARILVFAPVPPGPPEDGVSLPAIRFIREAAELGHEVIVAYRPIGRRTVDGAIATNPDVQAAALPIPASRRVPSTKFWLGVLVPPAVTPFVDKAAIDAARSLAHLHTPDCVVGFLAHTAPLALATGVDKALVVANDVLADAMWESAALTRSTPVKIARRLHAYSMRCFESRVYREVGSVSFVTTAEAARAEAAYHIEPIVQPNGVDPLGHQPRDGRGTNVLFVGSFGSARNREAAHLLVASVFPRVLERVPTARLRIVGHAAPRSLEGMAPSQGSVEVFSDAESLQPHFDWADVGLLPHRLASGIKNAALLMLASGLPVVGSPQAFMEIAVPDWNLYIHDDPAGQASAAVRLLMDSEQRSRASAANAGLRISYSWREYAKNLIEAAMRG